MDTLMLTLANMGVNLDDVVDVINNCLPQLIFFGVVVLLVILERDLSRVFSPNNHIHPRGNNT